ncbi:hypothetical protein HGA91_00320 [candidate division WWE3 bacterium]|nr:hypothetical protein [candidate division WWE3 bacterium]
MPGSTGIQVSWMNDGSVQQQFMRFADYDTPGYRNIWLAVGENGLELLERASHAQQRVVLAVHSMGAFRVFNTRRALEVTFRIRRHEDPLLGETAVDVGATQLYYMSRLGTGLMVDVGVPYGVGSHYRCTIEHIPYLDYLMPSSRQVAAAIL